MNKVIKSLVNTNQGCGPPNFFQKEIYARKKCATYLYYPKRNPKGLAPLIMETKLTEGKTIARGNFFNNPKKALELL